MRHLWVFIMLLSGSFSVPFATQAYSLDKAINVSENSDPDKNQNIQLYRVGFDSYHIIIDGLIWRLELDQKEVIEGRFVITSIARATKDDLSFNGTHEGVEISNFARRAEEIKNVIRSGDLEQINQLNFENLIRTKMADKFYQPLIAYSDSPRSVDIPYQPLPETPFSTPSHIRPAHEKSPVFLKIITPKHLSKRDFIALGIGASVYPALLTFLHQSTPLQGIALATGMFVSSGLATEGLGRLQKKNSRLINYLKDTKTAATNRPLRITAMTMLTGVALNGCVQLLSSLPR
jgi:hypothetical protein